MTDEDPADDPALSRTDARLVLLQVAKNESGREEYLDISEYCDARVLQDVIDLAWTHQFEDDRSDFKQGVSALMDYVVSRALDDDE